MSQIHVLDGQTDLLVAVLSNTSERTVIYDDSHLQQLSGSKETFDFTTVPESDATPFLRERNRLIIPVGGGIFREFIIDETIQDFHKVEVYSTASHLELKKGKPLPAGKHEGQSLNTMMDIVLSGTGWKRGNTDYSGTATIEFDNYVSPFQALQETAYAHEMELSFRIETNGNKVTGRYVDAVKRIGGFIGREINSGKDLINATRRETTEEVVTALVGLGPEREDGSRIVVEVTNEEARQVWGRDGRHLWEVLEVQSDNQEMSEAQVRQYATQSLNARIAAAIEYTIDGADLEHILGYENEKIRLGDSVRIKATEYEPPLYLDARVIAIEAPITDPTEKKFTLGEFIEYEEDEIRALRDYFRNQLAQKTNIFYGDNPPTNTNWIWIDTSGASHVMKIYNHDTGQWEETGTQGPPGLSFYTWVKYADDAQGNGMTDDPSGKDYIGIAANKPTPKESDDPTDYTWSLIKGADGENGKDGKDGETTYTWVKYADDENGSGISDEPTGKRYIGFAYNKTTPTESNDPADYVWSLIRGADGEDGKDGVTTYTWIKYADNAIGGGLSDDPTGKKYIGVAHNKTTPVESTNASEYTWALMMGPAGPNRVDSTTEIAANVINSNHINVYELSSLTANLGTVYSGQLNSVNITSAYITGTTITGSVFRSSDGASDMELTDGHGKIENNTGSWAIWNASGFQVGTINVSQTHKSIYLGTTTGGAGYIASDNSSLQMRADLLMSQGKQILGDGLLRMGASDSWGNISSYINMYSGGGISISPSSRLTSIYGALEISGAAVRMLSGTSMSFDGIGSYGNQLYLNSSGDWVKNYRETGYCGVGAREHVKTTSTLAGVGVNFRTQKNYIPSSAGFFSSAGNVTPYAIDFSGHGFWLYINGTNTAGAYPYWRGTYNC